MISFIFYLFAIILVGSGVKVITSRNPMHAALFLVLAFFSSAAIWLLLQAEFLAITLILVYVGAVMVLFLFVVMMLDINVAPLREGFTKNLPVGITVGALVFVEMAFVLVAKWPNGDKELTLAAADAVPNTEVLGNLLYTDYLYPFEIAAAILLVAMVAAIVLTMRIRRQKKFLSPEQQVAVRREDRIRLVNMPAEQKD